MTRKTCGVIWLSVMVTASMHTTGMTGIASPSAVDAHVPVLQDEHYKNACGPIACFVALRALGASTPLNDIARDCHWAGDRLTTLHEMQTALSAVHGIECTAVRLTPQELCRLLEDHGTVIILPVRRETDTVDHAFCAVNVRSDSSIEIVDYPKIRSWKMIGELTEVWDGPALVVRVSSSRTVLSYLAYLMLPTVAAVALASVVGNHAGRYYNGRVKRATRSR